MFLKALFLCSFADVSHLSSSVGKTTTEKVLKLPIERRHIPFLVSKEALEGCSIWCKYFLYSSSCQWIFLRLTFDLSPGNMVGSTGEEALAAYKQAWEALSAKKAAPKATASGNDDEVQFIRRSKRKAVASSTPSSKKKKVKGSESTLKASPPSQDNQATVLANLNAKVFPSIPASLSEGDSFEVVQFLQGNLLQVERNTSLSSSDIVGRIVWDFDIAWLLLVQAMSQLFHLGKMMKEQASSRDELDSLTSQLRKEKHKVLSKEKEIRALKLKLKSPDIRQEILRRRRSSRWRSDWRIWGKTYASLSTLKRLLLKR